VWSTKRGVWLDGTTSHSYIKQTYGSYGWITGWGRNADNTTIRNPWQKTTDTYAAATINTDDYDEYFSHGFIGTLARQAYYEMWNGEPLSQYNHIVNSFGQHNSYRTVKNNLMPLTLISYGSKLVHLISHRLRNSQMLYTLSSRIKCWLIIAVLVLIGASI